jgi:hypothetical protein
MGGHIICLGTDVFAGQAQLEDTALRFQVYGPGGDPDTAKAARILPIVHRYLCPDS